MRGAGQSAANPLTARYGVIHGVAVGLLLPGVVRFNSVACEDDYRELCGASSEGSESLASRLEEFRSLSGLPGRLSDCKVNKEDIPLMSLEAAGQWTAQFNPREVTPVGFSEIYRAAY